MEMQELNELIEDFQDVKNKVYMLEERFDKMNSFLVTPLKVSSIKSCFYDIYTGICDVSEELTDIKREVSTTGSDCQ